MTVSDRFVMNGYLWKIRFVNEDDQVLMERTGRKTIATTDPIELTINLSDRLTGDELMTVFLHELGHAAMVSYHLIPKIHEMTKREYWIDMEEFICNFLADFGFKIFTTAFDKLGYDAWKLIPKEFDKQLVA